MMKKRISSFLWKNEKFGFKNTFKFGVSASEIKELRRISGAPIGDCKKMLEIANGDIDEATKLLYEKGLSQAEKRMSQDLKAAVGMIGASSTNQGYILAEVKNELICRLCAKLTLWQKTNFF